VASDEAAPGVVFLPDGMCRLPGENETQPNTTTFHGPRLYLFQLRVRVRELIGKICEVLEAPGEVAWRGVFKI